MTKLKFPFASKHKARVRQFCGTCAYIAGCGRWIEPGEMYYKTARCGLDSYSVCEPCASRYLKGN